MNLSSLKPSGRRTVLSILERLGFDTSRWYDTRGYPASNPAYCYRWSFLNEVTGDVVFCLWFDCLELENDTVFCIKDHSESVAHLRGYAPAVIKRMEDFYDHLSMVSHSGIKCRVIICSRVGMSFRVSSRQLDSNFWIVKRSGNVFRMIRC